jgi:hypothetical protein
VLLADTRKGRNEEYLASSKTFARTVVVSAAVINLLPRFLKPYVSQVSIPSFHGTNRDFSVVGPVVTLYDKFHYWKCAKYTIPLVRQRLATSGQIDDKPQASSIFLQTGPMSEFGVFKTSLK